MDVNVYGVYVRVDELGRIVDIDSDAFITNLDDWVKIDEGDSRVCYLAQGNYLPTSLQDDRGVWRYKLIDGAVVERTIDEMDADYHPVTEKEPIENRMSEIERKTAELEESLDMLLSGVTSDE